MKKSLYDQINNALKDRGDWATRQHTNYTMRNGGIRRKKHAYPGDPDGWYPLGNTLLEKLKPLYVQQLYGAETVANFVCLKPQDEEMTSSVSYWFDYQLKQRSNFERTMIVAIDQMLEQAFTPIKVRWDVDAKRLAWEQIDPLHLIVPNSCQEYNDNGGTDWIVHVLHMSVAEYEANPKFEQGDAFVKSIKGKGKQSDSDADNKQQTVDYKEGINCSADENEVVLWEVYNRDRKSKKITVETISPLVSCEDDENVVRPAFTLPYNKGCFKSGEHFPFGKLRCEIKGKGHYSSRGVIESNAWAEMSLTKTLNTMHEWQDFFSKPMFVNTGASPIPAAQNWKSGPGKILPAGLEPAPVPVRPDSLREDMNLIRALAEDGTQIPDFGASEHLTGKVPATQTATGQNLIAAQSGQGNDLRARVLKLDLADLLSLAWSLYLQYGNVDESLTYLVDGSPETLDAQALHESYEIVPNGSADSWNKSALVQKRMAYYQTLLQNPYIDVAELTKWLLEGDDPKMVKRLFQDPQEKTKGEESLQIVECLEMEVGFVPDINPSDDDKTHLMVMDQLANKKLQDGTMTQALAAGMLKHGPDHMGALKEKKDPMLNQVEAKLQPTAQALAMFVAQGQQQPPNVLQMQQPAGNTPGVTQDGQSSPTGPAGAASQDKPSAVLNALAASFKAGLPVSMADFSAALVAAGLSPLSAMSQPISPPAPTQSAPVGPQPQAQIQ